MTAVYSFSFKILSKVCRPFLSGKNPRKRKSCIWRPEPTSPVKSAEAPGIISIFIPCSMASWMRRYAGSEIPGVPASEM
jgi:hypothetical protein